MQTDSKRIAIYLTNKCNLRCKHCFIEGSPLNDTFLSWSQVKTALNYFFKEGFKQVELTGGESCLSPFFLPAAKEAKKLGYKVGISTNGTNSHIFKLITPEIADKITFSLDGATAATHDRLRGQGVYKLCLRNIRETIARGFRVEVVYTVHRYNIREVTAIIRLLDRIGVARLSFNFINNTGSAINHQNYLIEAKHWSQVKKVIMAHAQTKTMELRFPPLFVDKGEFEEIKKNTNYRCFAADPVKVELYPDGFFYGCCFTTTNKEYSLGRVFDDRVEADNSGAKSYVEKYSHLSCPAIQTSLVFPTSPNLVPVCVYIKVITKPGPAA